MKKIHFLSIALSQAQYIPPEMPRMVQIDGGNSKDLEPHRRFCTFPFMYKGEVYEDCTTVDSANGRAWCAAGPAYRNPIDPWGYCGDEMEMPSNSVTIPNYCTDEERVGAGCHVMADCTKDEFGDRTCTCRPGFEGDGSDSGTGCTDIDECADESLNFCDVNYAKCFNIPGNYYCRCNEDFAGSGFKDSCFAKNPCTAGTSECTPNSKCLENGDYMYGCQCDPGHQGHVCREVCSLFDVTCDIDTGFTINLNRQCRLDQYNHIDIPNTGLTVYAKDLDADTGNDPDWDSLAADCFYGGQTEKNIGFNECGGAIVTYDEDTKRYTYHTYVHHRFAYNGLVLRMNDQIAIKCELGEIKLNTADDSDVPISIATNDENNGIGDISEEELLEKFKLALEMGKADQQGDFTALVKDEKVDVGQPVVVRLTHADVDNFRFALKGCAAKASDASIPLYDEYCPATTAALVQPIWKNHLSFGITVFRIRQDTTITFTCNVAFFPTGTNKVLFPIGSDYPEDCPTSRKRRSAEAKGANEMTIDLTVNLQDGKSEITGTESPGHPRDNSGSLPQTCSSLALFSIFGYSVLNL